MKKGYCGIGIFNYMHECNVGTLFRTAVAFEVDYIFTIGRKYKKQGSDTPNSCLHIPYFHYENSEAFLNNIPRYARLVCLENKNNAYDLPNFTHPVQAVYLLGNEGNGIPERILEKSLTVNIPSTICLNVSTAGAICLYDRAAKK